MGDAPAGPRTGRRLAGALLVGLGIAAAAGLLGGLVMATPYLLQPAVIEADLAQRAELACAKVVVNRARIPAPSIDATDPEYFDQIDGYMRHYDNLIPVLRGLDGAAEDRAFRRFVDDIEDLRRIGDAFVRAFDEDDVDREDRLGSEFYDLLGSLRRSAEANHLSLCID